MNLQAIFQNIFSEKECDTFDPVSDPKFFCSHLPDESERRGDFVLGTFLNGYDKN